MYVHHRLCYILQAVTLTPHCSSKQELCYWLAIYHCKFAAITIYAKEYVLRWKICKSAPIFTYNFKCLGNAWLQKYNCHYCRRSKIYIL